MILKGLLGSFFIVILVSITIVDDSHCHWHWSMMVMVIVVVAGAHSLKTLMHPFYGCSLEPSADADVFR